MNQAAGSRVLTWCGALAISGWLLASCGGSNQGAAGSSAVSSGSAKPAASAASSGSASVSASSASAAGSTAGSAGAAAANANQPIKIGVILSLTGPLASTGKDSQSGFTQYMDSINNTVSGRKIQVIYADDAGAADMGLAKAKQLVENDKVQILAGVISTPICYAIATYVKQVQIPFAVTGDCGAQQLTTDPKFASPYLARFTETSNQQFSPPADWGSKQGYRKAIIVTSDFAAGIEVSDAFSSIFIDRGGSIVQELHPPLGTNDFGPYLAQFDKSADFIALFLPGTDGLKFGQQYPTYIEQHKVPMFDMGGNITESVNLPQLNDKAVGFVANFGYTTAIDSPTNKAFVKAFQDNHPGELPPLRSAQGYSGAQAIVAALQKVNGNIEQKQRFLDALDATSIDSLKGPIKLDKYHDIVQTMYVYQITKDGNTWGHKLLTTYPNADQFWGRGEEQSLHFPYGQLKGKWVGMTKEGLSKLQQP